MDIAASGSGDRVAPDRLRRRVTTASELTCEHAAPVIHAYAFGRLPRSDAALARDHLRLCANCQSIVDEIDRDTAEFLEATGLTQLPDDLIDLIIGAASGGNRPCDSPPPRNHCITPTA